MPATMARDTISITPSPSDEAAALKAENARLTAKLERLEAENSTLRDEAELSAQTSVQMDLAYESRFHDLDAMSAENLAVKAESVRIRTESLVFATERTHAMEYAVACHHRVWEVEVMRHTATQELVRVSNVLGEQEAEVKRLRKEVKGLKGEVKAARATEEAKTRECTELRDRRMEDLEREEGVRRVLGLAVLGRGWRMTEEERELAWSAARGV